MGAGTAVTPDIIASPQFRPGDGVVNIGWPGWVAYPAVVGVETLAHGPDGAHLPPFTPAALLTQADLVHWITVALLFAAAAYLSGVMTLRRRGDHWPLSRTLLFVGPGLGSIALVTLSGLAAYESSLISAHMAQHMVLTMVAPIFLALGAPVTLALRTLPRRWRRILVAVLHAAPVRVLTFPLAAFAIFVLSPFGLYFSDLYPLSLENALVHEWVHLHFLISGCLFFWPLVGLDPLPGRWPYPGRVLLMVLMVPTHTVLGLTIMESTTLLGGDWYPALGLDWVDPFADQRVAGGILWAGGELVSVAVLAILVVQWIRASEREARRIDRELDRAEAAAAAVAATAGAPPAGAATADATPAGPAGTAPPPRRAVRDPDRTGPEATMSP